MDKYRVEMYHERVGKGYLVQCWQNTDKRTYDIELAYGGRHIVKLNTGCIGNKSANHHYKDAIKFMKKLIFLLDGYAMACHNKLCYSDTYLMDKPKAGYEESWEWENDRINMLIEWIYSHMMYYGNEKYKILKNEFNM